MSISVYLCPLNLCNSELVPTKKNRKKNECLQNQAHCHLEVVDVPLPQQLVLASCSESKFWPFPPTCLRCEVRLQKVPLCIRKKNESKCEKFTGSQVGESVHCIYDLEQLL